MDIQELAQEWISELRSGRWQQITTTLFGQGGIQSGQACPLGVAYYVALQNGYESPSVHPDNDYELIQEVFNLSDTEMETIWKLNDRAGYDFDQIANYLEGFYGVVV